MSSEFATIDLSQRRQEVRSGQEKSVEGLHIRPCQSGSVGRFIKEWQSQTRQKALQEVQYVGPLSQSDQPRSPDNFENSRHLSTPLFFNNRTIARHSQPIDSDRSKRVTDWQNSNPQKLWYPRHFRQAGHDTNPDSVSVDANDPRIQSFQHDHLKTDRNDLSDSTSDKPLSVEHSIVGFIQKCKAQTAQDDRLKGMPSYVLLAADMFVQELEKIIDRAEARDYVAYETVKTNNDLHRVLINIFVRVSQGVFSRQGTKERLNKRLDYVNKEDKRVLNPRQIPWERLNYQNELESDDNLTKRIVNESIEGCISDLRRRVAKQQTENYKLENHHINVKPIGGTFIYDRYRYNEKKPRSYRVCRKLLSEETGNNEAQDPRGLWDVDPDELDKATGLLPGGRNQVFGGQHAPTLDFDHLLPKRDRDRLHLHLSHR